jgi:4-aminobutyrate aminotransferase-like enzyme/Ser/Thr protein kinase RdoA (MazF antagonist)
VSARAELSPPEALRLVRDVWRLDARSAEPLPGERDTNFLIRGSGASAWVLKVAPADASEGELRLEMEALLWLARRDGAIPVPHLRQLPDGETIARVPAGGRTHTARVLDYLEGRILAGVRPRTFTLLRDLGRVLGRVDEALRDFRPTHTRPSDFPWDLRNAGNVIELGLNALSTERRALLEPILERFRHSVEPRLAHLPSGVLHGDANDHNVLVESSGPDPRDGARVSGLIDFGDLSVGPRVAEPAIAAAYALLGERDPIHAAAAVVSGYHEVASLSEEELDVLWDLILARLAVSVAISARRTQAELSDPYLTVSEAPAWHALEMLRAVHPRFARDVLRGACGFEPCPRSVSVKAWLKAHPAKRSVMPAGVMTRPLVLDLSVSTLEVADAVGPVDADVLGPQIFGLMEKAGASVGIGRYAEPRALYAEPHFEHPSGDPLLKRSVHIAVDLFAAAGTPVLAPLDGTVQSCVDNEGASNYGPTVILEHGVGEVTFWTLYGHLSRETLAALEPGKQLRAGDAFGTLGDPSVNGAWPPHLHFQLITDLLDRSGEFPGVAASHELEVWKSLSPDPRTLIELPEGAGAPPGSTIDALLGRRHGLLGQNLSVSYRRPLHIVRGRGQRLFDANALAYLDCVNNVAHVGHAHPRVVDAVARQKGALETNTRYLHESILRFAERLLETLPEPLAVCWFVNSGSEANELAIRMARAATGRYDIVVLEDAYHGNTSTLVDVSPYKHAGPGGHGAPDWVHVAVVPDDYRGAFRRDEPDRGSRYAASVAEAARRAALRGSGPAAFLHESLLSCAGQIDPPPGYLSAAYAAIRNAGGLAIADEVQVGLGRVGTHFWGFETQGVVPDIVTVGKPLGNGHPLGAVITTRAVADAFHNGMEYFNTFGGNPASCAAGIAVLDVIRDEDLQAHARAVGDRLLHGLATLGPHHAAVGDVRGRGLFVGVELVRDPDTREPDGALADYLVQRARERGVLLSTDGPHHNVIKLKPPMVFDAADADRVVTLLDELLEEDFARDRMRSPTA